jgi:3-dehydroquinate dehydratase
VSQVARGVICGFGIDGYALAIAGLATMIDAKV